MDTEKYKSIAVPIDVWRLAQSQAKENERSVARQIAWLLRKEDEKSNVQTTISKVAS